MLIKNSRDEINSGMRYNNFENIIDEIQKLIKAESSRDSYELVIPEFHQRGLLFSIIRNGWVVQIQDHLTQLGYKHKLYENWRECSTTLTIRW